MDRLLLQAQRLALPIGIATYATSQSMYDVKGGSRAVIFDRTRGV